MASNVEYQISQSRPQTPRQIDFFKVRTSRSIYKLGVFKSTQNVVIKASKCNKFKTKSTNKSPHQKLHTINRRHCLENESPNYFEHNNCVTDEGSPFTSLEWNSLFDKVFCKQPKKNRSKDLNQTLNTAGFSQISKNLNTFQKEEKDLITSDPFLQETAKFVKTSINSCKSKNVSQPRNHLSVVSAEVPNTTVEEPVLSLDEYLLSAIPYSKTQQTSAFLDLQSNSDNKFTKGSKENLEEFDDNIDFEMNDLSDNTINNVYNNCNNYNNNDSVNSFLNKELDDDDAMQMYQKTYVKDLNFQNNIDLDQTDFYLQFNEEIEQLSRPSSDFDHINVSENAIDISVCFDHENNSTTLSQALSSNEFNPVLNPCPLKKFSENENDKSILPLIYNDYDYDDELHNISSKLCQNTEKTANDNQSDTFEIKTNKFSETHESKLNKLTLSTKNINNNNYNLETPEIIDYILEFDNEDKNVDIISSKLSFHQKDEIIAFDDSLCSLISSQKDGVSIHSPFNYSNLSPYPIYKDCGSITAKNSLLDSTQKDISCFSDVTTSQKMEASNLPCTSFSNILYTNDSVYKKQNSSEPYTITTIVKTNSSNKTNNNKRKRGRPSKEHSDRPDPIELQKMTEIERKRREDRFKNNEASRISRQKNKKRQEELLVEEKILEQRNKELQKQISELEFIQNKFKKFLFNEIRWQGI